MQQQFRRIVLARRPTGRVVPEDFSLEKFQIPTLRFGQVLVRNEYLSLDPYMRGRMNDARSYASPQPQNETMIGATAGIVLASEHPDFQPGDRVTGMLGWCEGAVAEGAQLQKICDPTLPSSAYLGVLGMPGVTAWYGVNRILLPKADETLLVSAAAGAVGSLVGQLAKLAGCRAVGIAGGTVKCRDVVENLGFDACVDYRAESFKADLRTATPDGVDMLFENVGGQVFDAALSRMNAHGRIALCGMIAGYEETAEPLKNLRSVLINRLSMRGFTHHGTPRRMTRSVGGHGVFMAGGRLQWQEPIVDGLENAPAAFIDLLRGANLGKQLIRL